MAAMASAGKKPGGAGAGSASAAAPAGKAVDDWESFLNG
jgi:hypothetical protein